MENQLKNNPKYIGAMKFSVLKKLPRVEEGEIAFCTDTHKVMIYNNGKWNELKNDGLKLNLYDLNKSIISQLPDLNNDKINEVINIINNFSKQISNSYYMMYGSEINYFTLFKININLKETIGEAVISCLQEIGSIKSIDLNSENNAIEIWLNYKNNEEEILTVLYLFPYDLGLIEVCV